MLEVSRVTKMYKKERAVDDVSSSNVSLAFLNMKARSG